MKTHAPEQVQTSHQPLQAQQAENTLLAASPQASLQRKRNDILNTSPITLQQKALANQISTSPRMALQRKQLATIGRLPIQRAKDDELQAKVPAGATLQRAKEDELQAKMPAGATLQRAKEDELQAKMPAGATLQRAKEDELQAKMPAGATLQRAKDDELQAKMPAGATLQRAEDSAKPNQTGMPDQLKSGIESLSGMSMDHVKVHYNSAQPAQLNALAYAQGSDIHVAPGQEQHLPHEAWHVVQQAQGRVQPTMQMKEGVPVNDDRGLESEADVMGAKAMSLS